MPRRLLILLLPVFIALLVPQPAEASHIVGTDLRYECLGNGIYRVHIYWYEYCDAAAQGLLMKNTLESG
ncbi:MAG: hypothetical protein ACOCZ8_06515, partial [Bacteroidota bacterium]